LTPGTENKGVRSGTAYIALCVIVPLAWGILSARVFDWYEARLGKTRARPEADSVDMYHI
jgi:hypothetical protein